MLAAVLFTCTAVAPLVARNDCGFPDVDLTYRKQKQFAPGIVGA
jgi:hypothetical protein